MSHLMNRELKAISLFSGAGGMDIGVQQAGFDIIASIENDPYCCETLRSNLDRHGRKSLKPTFVRLRFSTTN